MAEWSEHKIDDLRGSTDLSSNPRDFPKNIDVAGGR